MAVSISSNNVEQNITEMDTISIEQDPQIAIANEQRRDPHELIVLDPDHPLMKKFQDALTKLLMKYIEKAGSGIQAAKESLKNGKDEHSKLGNELYRIQQELLKSQAHIESNGAELVKKKEANQSKLKAVEEARKTWDNLSKTLNQETSKCNQKRQELEKINLKILLLNKAKDGLHSDVITMKNAATKIVSQLSQLETSKVEQDLLLDSLQEHIDQLKGEIAIYESQFETQKMEYSTSETLLIEIEAEIMHVKSDRKALIHQWQSSLNVLRQRNESYSRLNTDYQKQIDYLRNLETEHASIRKSIEAEQKEHEKLTAIYNKSECQVASLKKQNLQIQNKFEAAKQEYSTYVRMLQETESALSQLTQDQHERKAQLEQLRKSYEKECEKKLDLEKKIADELQRRLIADKAVKYVEKLATNLLETNKDLEIKTAELENKLATESLEQSKIATELDSIQRQIDETNKEIEDRNLMINRMEQEIKAGGVIIGKKEVLIDSLNRKIAELRGQSGDMEISPMEVRILEVSKALSDKQEEITKMEKEWLRNQAELVKNVSLREESMNQVNILQKQYSTMDQQHIRLDREIEVLKQELAKLERLCENMHKAIGRLNSTISRQRQQTDDLQNAKFVEEMKFVRQLKEKEIETADMQERLEKMREDKEKHLNELLDVERQVMLWEKKAQMAEEAKESINSEIGSAEVREMKMEIQRMELKKKALLRQQEMLTTSLENTVHKREILLDRKESSKNLRNRPDTKESVAKQISQLKSRIELTEKEIKMRQSEIDLVTKETEQLYERLNKLKSESQVKQFRIDELSESLIQLANERHLNLFNMHASQQQLALWRSVDEGRYKPIFRTKKNCDEEVSRQTNRVNSLLSVIDEIIRENPVMQKDLQPLKYLLEAKQGLIDEITSSHCSSHCATATASASEIDEDDDTKFSLKIVDAESSPEPPRDDDDQDQP